MSKTIREKHSFAAGMTVGSFTTSERNALTPSNGDVIYNSTLDRHQMYQGGSWVTPVGLESIEITDLQTLTTVQAMQLLISQAADLGYFIGSGGLLSPSATAGRLDLGRSINSFGGSDVDIAAQTAISTTITSLADATHPKWVIVEITSGSVVQFNTGTASGSPAFPALTSGRVAHGLLYIPANATEVDTLLTTDNGKAKLIDCRVVRPLVEPHVSNDYPYVVSGCTWAGDALGSTRAASMASGVVVIGGKRLLVAGVTARTFTASRDTYVDFTDNGDGTALINYTEVTNNAASPALVSSGTVLNTLRNAIVVTGASSIASAALTDGSVAAINQGSVWASVPNPSTSFSIPAGFDQLGNPIYNTKPRPTRIGYRQFTSAPTFTGTAQNSIAAHACPFIIPPGPKRRVCIRAILPAVYTTNASINTQVQASFQIDSDGNQRGSGFFQTANTSGSDLRTIIAEYETLLAVGTHLAMTYVRQSAAGTLNVLGDVTYANRITVDLI